VPADLADRDGAVDAAALAAAELERAGADPALVAALTSAAVPAEELVAGGAVTLTAQGLEPLLVDLDGRTVTTGGRAHPARSG
jgi:hypothetical protein